MVVAVAVVAVEAELVVGMSGEAGSFLTTILGAGPRDLLEPGRLDMMKASRAGGDMEVEVGEPALGGRQDSEAEEEEREDRLKDVRKRRALAVCSEVEGGITTGGSR